MSPAPVRVGDMLVESGVITAEQLKQALRHQTANGGRLGTNLVELGFVDERTLASFLAKQLQIPACTGGQIDRISPEVLRLVSASAAMRLKVLPMRIDGGRLWVAMADPTDRLAIEELERTTRHPIRTMVAPELLVQYGLEKHYQAPRRRRAAEAESGSGLLSISASVAEPAVRGIDEVAPPPPPVPVYGAPGASALAELDAATGYLDEAPVTPPAVPLSRAADLLSLKGLVEQLSNVSTDEGVLDLAVRYLSQDMPRVWVFLLRGGELWSWGGRGYDKASMSGVHVSTGELEVVAHALSTGDPLLGRLQPASLGPLSGAFGVFDEALGLVLPVRISKRPVGCIFGLDVTLNALRKKAEFEKLAQKLDHALHINYLRRQLLAD